MSAVPPSQLTIRRAGPEDLTAAAALVAEAWTSTNAEYLPAETMAALSADHSIAGLVASRSQELWLAERSAIVAAVLGIDATGYIWACYVHPEHQRQGIGAALLDRVKLYCKEKELPQLYLDLIDGNDGAQAFYVAQGWIEESRRPEPLPGHTATAIRLICPL